MSTIKAVAVCLSLAATVGPACADVIAHYTATEFQPRIKWSGRVNDVAIDPSDANHVLATTESGGLWRSRDRGVTWESVAALPAFSLNAVKFISANPRVVLVTAFNDMQRRPIDGGPATTSGGGVWMSRDGGATWTQPTRAMPFVGTFFRVGDTSCPAQQHEGWAIAEDEDSSRVFVATSCGFSYSDDLATAENPAWTHVYPSRATALPHQRRMTSIAAMTGSGVIAGGGDGVWFSTDNGVNWSRTTTPVGSAVDLHAAAAVPGMASSGFLITLGAGGDRALWRPIDSGRTWRSIAGDPPVRAAASPTSTRSRRCGAPNGPSASSLAIPASATVTSSRAIR